MNGIKQEHYGIKPDPDAGTPVQYMDDEFFEDTGEMTMPQPDTKSDVWLTRIDKWLYDAVSKWDDLAEGNDNDQIQIGEVLAFNTTSGVDQSRPMRLFFSERWRAKSKLPTAFELQPAQTTDTVLGNTYVFTEKDLPGYKPNGFGQGHRGGPGSYNTQDPKARIQKRGKYRKAIPKQTALIGHATRQYQMNPLPTKEYKDFEAQRLHHAIQGSHMETVIIKDPGVANYNNVQSKFTSFIKQTTNRKPQQNKAARISHRELLDLLHSLFDEYEYWSMKALKTRTKQPEQFLKEVLPELAHLVKSGSFASHWQRQQQFSIDRNLNNQQSALAPDVGGDDSEDEEMEDVV
jgi:transcription initiation factor TFIIF subunit beta